LTRWVGGGQCGGGGEREPGGGECSSANCAQADQPPPRAPAANNHLPLPPSPARPQPKLCNRFKVRSYPTVLAGAARDVAAANRSALKSIDDSAEHRGKANPGVVVEWIGEVFNL
jgi:hypothetical protein